MKTNSVIAIVLKENQILYEDYAIYMQKHISVAEANHSSCRTHTHQ